MFFKMSRDVPLTLAEKCCKTAALISSGWTLSHSTIRECIKSWVIPNFSVRRPISSQAFFVTWILTMMRAAIGFPDGMAGESDVQRRAVACCSALGCGFGFATERAAPLKDFCS